jgi:3-hydroxyisobutyrate dehydrogenase-like beta-hydroxyacid dehydrogenase
MLPKGPHVHNVFMNSSNGLLSISDTSSGRPKLFIECSTIDVKTSLLVGEEVRKSGLGFFADAPVSGGPNGAYAATLTFMVGSTVDVFERVKPIIQTMGKEGSIFYCGAASAGLATKQINNYLSAICNIGTCEAMNMGIRYGLDPNVLAGVINVSSGKNYNSLDQNPVKGVNPTAAAAKDFEGGFSMELCKGVIDMAVESGKEVGAKSVMSNVLEGVFEKAVRNEKTSGKDCRSVYRLFAEDDGRELD